MIENRTSGPPALPHPSGEQAHRGRLAVVLLAALLATACAQRNARTVRKPAAPVPAATAPTQPAPVAPTRADGQAAPGASALAAGLEQYDRGQYDAAAETLNGALKLGLTPPGQVAAHKHLAFIHCLANRPGSCREEFRRALDIDPAFDLRPSEAGHPMWGPVFRTTRAEQR